MFQPVEILNLTEALRITDTGKRIADRKQGNVSRLDMSKCHDGVWRHLQKAQRFQKGGVFSQFVDNAEYIINPNR